MVVTETETGVMCFKEKEGATSQGTLEAEKGKETDSRLEPPEGTSAAKTLSHPSKTDFMPWLPEL